jgi:hypothetical protein
MFFPTLGFWCYKSAWRHRCETLDDLCHAHRCVLQAQDDEIDLGRAENATKFCERLFNMKLPYNILPPQLARKTADRVSSLFTEEVRLDEAHDHRALSENVLRRRVHMAMDNSYAAICDNMATLFRRLQPDEGTEGLRNKGLSWAQVYLIKYNDWLPRWAMHRQSESIYSGREKRTADDVNGSGVGDEQGLKDKHKTEGKDARWDV